MVKYLYILLVCVSSVAFGQAEDTLLRVRKSSIRFGMGLTHFRMIDQGYTDSRLLFRGTASKFSLAYGRETGMHLFSFSVSGSSGKVESKHGNLPSNYFFLQPSLEFLRNIRTGEVSGKKNDLFLGVLLSSTNQAIENEKVINNISIFSLHGLYFSLCNRLSLNERHYVQLSYLMPAVVFENRLLWNGGASPYTYRDTQNIPRFLTSNGTFSYFDLLHNVQLGLDYVVKTGKASSVRFGYKFFSASSFIEAPLHLYSNELSVELKIGL
jgi:hypothetical protein